MVRYLFYTIGDLTYQSPLVIALLLWHSMCFASGIENNVLPVIIFMTTVKCFYERCEKSLHVFLYFNFNNRIPLKLIFQPETV